MKKTMMILAIAASVWLSGSAHAVPNKEDMVLKNCKFQNEISYVSEQNTYYLESQTDSLLYTTFSARYTDQSSLQRFTLIDTGTTTTNGGHRLYYVIESTGGRCLVPYKPTSGAWTLSAQTCSTTNGFKWFFVESSVSPGNYFMRSYKDQLTNNTATLVAPNGIGGLVQMSNFNGTGNQRFKIGCNDLAGNSGNEPQ